MVSSSKLIFQSYSIKLESQRFKMADRHFIKVKGQSGDFPKIGLGTANLGERTADAVCNALKNGCTLIDAALCYRNQKEVGEGIKMSGLSRNQFQVTTKVGFFPPKSDGVWMFNANNMKGGEKESIDLCLEQLGLDYVDLLLIHNPTASVPEYNTASCPHFFELFGNSGHPDAVKPEKLPGGEHIRPLILDSMLRKAKQEGITKKESLEIRRQSWACLERAHKEGKAKMIGVSNYPAELLEEMKTYAEIMPAVNQIEYHPRFASPATYTKCKELGILLQSYGILNSMLIANPAVRQRIDQIAKKNNTSAIQTCIRWAVQNQVCVIFRSGSKENQLSNLASLQGPDLSSEDMAAINALHENYPYYWLPEASIQTLD